MRNLDKGFKFDSKLAYIGNIQVSKGTLLTQIKKFQEEAQVKKFKMKNFNMKEPNLNEENNKKALLSTLQYPSVSKFGPLTSTLKQVQQGFIENDDHDHPNQSKIMIQSKKILKSDSKPLPLQLRRQLKEFRPDCLTKISPLKAKRDSNDHQDKFKRSIAKTLSTDIETPKDLRLVDQEDLLFENGLSPLFSNTFYQCEMLHYESADKSKQHQFRCFKESDLKIPKNFSRMIIHHEMDDDCPTDDEQLNLGIKTLHLSLRIEVEDEF